MSKRRDTGSHPVEELEMKDSVAYNNSVQHHAKRAEHEYLDFSKGQHQKGPSGKKGGDVLAPKRK
jgi:hypothetical protein